MAKKIIKDITKINPKFSTTGGTSDARFIRKIAPCLEFGLVNKTMHKVDECVSVSDLRKLTNIYKNILVEYFKVKLYKIKKSKIDNKGLYASRDIKNRTKIIEYKGKILTKKQVEENPKFDNEKAIYLFNINKNMILMVILNIIQQD